MSSPLILQRSGVGTSAPLARHVLEAQDKLTRSIQVMLRSSVPLAWSPSSIFRVSD